MINDTCFKGKIACHGMLRFISQTNPCIRKFLDLKRCNSLESRQIWDPFLSTIWAGVFQASEGKANSTWSAVISYTDLLSASSTRDLGTRVLTIGSRHFAWKLQKTWAVICGNAICLIFSVFSADLDILFSGSFSHLVKFYSYAQDFHPDVLCNDKHPRIK